MKKNLFMQARFVYADGGSAGQNAEVAQTPVPAPEQLKQAEAPKGPEIKPVTEATAAEEFKKMQEAAAKKTDATKVKLNTLAAVKVDEVKMPA